MSWYKLLSSPFIVAVIVKKKYAEGVDVDDVNDIEETEFTIAMYCEDPDIIPVDAAKRIKVPLDNIFKFAKLYCPDTVLAVIVPESVPKGLNDRVIG